MESIVLAAVLKAQCFCQKLWELAMINSAKLGATYQSIGSHNVIFHGLGDDVLMTRIPLLSPMSAELWSGTASRQPKICVSMWMCRHTYT